jgi:hypothetical protein
MWNWAREIRAAAATLLLAGAVAGPAAGQPPPGSLSGAVIDAGTGHGLEGATVVLEPLPTGLVAGRGLLGGARVALTDSSGQYHFPELAPGRYRLMIRRLGYRSAWLEAELRRPMDARLSVGLELEPIVLRPVAVRERAVPPFRRVEGSAAEPADARAAAERARQAMFLTPDTRALTLADVEEGIGLGESDVFRALQRLPGIATRDDYTAELWTRGAPWAQTRVTFDGLPLFNPVHALGIFSGLTPDVLGAVFLHPGVRSASLGDGAAGAVELLTRPGGGAGAVRGTADISMATAKLALEQRPGDGDAAWIVAARRSYLDVLTRGLDWIGLGEDLDLPYAFHDITARLDLPVGRASGLEASGLWEDDRLFGDVQGVLESTAARWGNAAGRLTLHGPLGPLAARHTVGGSRYRARIRGTRGDGDPRSAPWVEPPSDNRIEYVRIAAELGPRAAAGPAWLAGYELTSQAVRYDGPEPRFHPIRPDTAARVTGSGRLRTAALWGDVRLQAGPVAAQPGLRVEAGDAVANGGAVRVSPRLAVRWAVGDGTFIAAGLGRTYQYLQALALAGPSPHPAFHASQFWLWADPVTPAVRADVATLGAEQWLGMWLVSATGYVRRAAGVALPDPEPGPVADRPLFVTGTNRAHGVEAAVRRTTGPWTASLAWAWGESTMEAAGRTFPAATDRRHRVDAALGARLPAGLRAGVAWTAMTGAPFTRVLTRAADVDCSLFGFACGQHGGVVQAPNAERTPDYGSLDAGLWWSRAVRGAELSAYVQVRNILGRDNASTYSGSRAAVVAARGERTLVWDDLFERGLPRMPLIGARVAFGR